MSFPLFRRSNSRKWKDYEGDDSRVTSRGNFFFRDNGKVKKSGKKKEKKNPILVPKKLEKKAKKKNLKRISN